MYEILKAISEPNRIKILTLLKNEEMMAGEVASHFKVSRPAISQHLKILTDAGMLKEKRSGVKRLYSINHNAFLPLKEFLDEIWDQRLSKIKTLSERKKR